MNNTNVCNKMDDGSQIRSIRIADDGGVFVELMDGRIWGVGTLLRRCTKEGSFVQESLLFTERLVLSIVLLVVSVALLVGATNNAFIYTRF